MQMDFALPRLALLAAAICAAGLPAQTFDLDRGREPVVSLDGPWRFHPGDSPAEPGLAAPQWAAPGFDDSHWALLGSDRS